jgi:hypothetical protein
MKAAPLGRGLRRNSGGRLIDQLDGPVIRGG